MCGLGPAAARAARVGYLGAAAPCAVCLLQRTKATQHRSRLRESPDARRPPQQRPVAWKLPSIRTSAASGGQE